MTPTATKTRVNTLIDRAQVANHSMNTTYQNAGGLNIYVDFKRLDEANKAMAALEERRLKQGPVARIFTWLAAWSYLNQFGDPSGDMRTFRGDHP